MTPGDLMTWVDGYLAGWDRGDENREHVDHTDAVKAAFRRSETAARRKAWDEAVKRGENPTPYNPEEKPDDDG
jgi:hypothetical protein